MVVRCCRGVLGVSHFFYARVSVIIFDGVCSVELGSASLDDGYQVVCSSQSVFKGGTFFRAQGTVRLAKGPFGIYNGCASR